MMIGLQVPGMYMKLRNTHGELFAASSTATSVCRTLQQLPRLFITLGLIDPKGSSFCAWIRKPGKQGQEALTLSKANGTKLIYTGTVYIFGNYLFRNQQKYPTTSSKSLRTNYG